MKKVLAVAIIAILFISTFAVLTQVTNAGPSATSKPNISIQPSQKAAARGESFSVDVVVSNITTEQRVTGIQFRVLYDSNLLQATGVTEGPFMPGFGATFFIGNIDDDKNVHGGNVLVGDLLVPDQDGVWASFAEGTGTVATITFEAKEIILPIKAMLTIVKFNPNLPTENFLVNDDAKEVPCTITGGTINIGDVAFNLQPSPAKVALNESFSVQMVLSGVDLDENVTGAGFRVQYDSDYLEVTGVTEGPFLKQFGTTFFISAVDDDIARLGPNVLVGNQLLPGENGVWAEYPEGAGTIATITFKNIGPHPKYAPTTTELTIYGPDTFAVNDIFPGDNEVPSSYADAVVHIELPAPAILSIFPGQSYAVFGHDLVVSVMLSNLKVGWRVVGPQFRLCYDTNLFEVADVSEGSFMKQFGDTTFIAVIDQDFATYGGNVLVGILLNPDDNGVWAKFPYGSGELAIITLRPKVEVGINDPKIQTTLTLKDTMIVNDANEEVGEVLHTSNDGYVTILPMQPTLEVLPKLTQVINSTTPFSVDIDASELGVGWKCVGVQIRLQYDNEYLEVLEVTEGPFFKQFGDTLFFQAVDNDTDRLGGNVLVGILLLPDLTTGEWEQFASGNGTIVTITFKAIRLPRGTELSPEHVNLGILDQWGGKPESYFMDVDLNAITTNLLTGEARIQPTHVADVNYDGTVNMKDIGLLAKAFGALQGSSRYSADLEVAAPFDRIDLRDIGTAARAFGWPHE